MKSILLELIANALDITVLTLLFCKRLPRKNQSIIPTVMFVLIGFFLESVPAFFELEFYPTEIILFSTCLIYLFFRGGTWLHKIFWVSVSFATIFALAMIVSPVVSIITGINVKEMNDSSILSERALYLTIANIIKVIVFYLIANKPRRTQRNRLSMLVCLFIPAINVIFGTWIYKVYVDSYMSSSTDQIIVLLAISYLLVSISSIVLYEIIEKDSEKMVYFLAKENQYETMSQYTDQIKHISNEIQVWQHDMKQHLSCLHTLIEKEDVRGADDYMSKLSDKVKMSYMKINSGNYIADAVLSSKIRLATEKGIKVECSASVPEILSIDDVDFCSILSNTFDNAIEAAGKVDGASYVKCDIITIRNQLVIELENSSDGEYKCRNGIFESQKTNGIHGIGLRQVQSIVDKYDGICSIDAGKDRFKISISVPIISK